MATNGQPPPFDMGALFEHPAFKTLQRAQQQMVEQTAKALGGVTPDVLRDAGDHWQQAMQRAVGTWGEHTAPIAKQTAERAAARATTLAGVTAGLAQAWQALAQDLATPDGEGAAAWTAAAARFNEAVRAQVETATAASMEAAGDLQAVVQRFAGELQAPDAPWAAATTMPLGTVPDGARGEDAGSEGAGGEGAASDEVPIVALFEHVYETFDRSFGRLLNSPGLGLTREVNEDLAQAAAAYQAYLREQARYQTHMGGLFTQAVERFTTTLAERARAGEPVDSLRGLTRLWTSEADAVFTDAFRQPDYIELQNRLVAATMRYRQRRRVVAELVQQLNDQPTRSEVDEAFKLLHDARKEIKALRRDVAALKAQVEGAGSEGGASKPAPPRKGAAKKPAPAKKVTSAKKATPKKKTAPDDLTRLAGIGTVRAQKLRQAGYATFADLAAAAPADLAAAIGSTLFDEARAAQVAADAKALA